MVIKLKTVSVVIFSFHLQQQGISHNYYNNILWLQKYYTNMKMSGTDLVRKNKVKILLLLIQMSFFLDNINIVTIIIYLKAAIS